MILNNPYGQPNQLQYNIVQPYPMNNTGSNLIVPPPALMIAQPNQINKVGQKIVDDITNNNKAMNMQNEIEHLKQKNQELHFKNLENKIDSIARTQSNTPNININNNNNNTNTNTNINTNVVIGGDRLKYTTGMYCLFIVLNIFLPGIGTIIAGAMYGSQTISGLDRTGAIICHGVAQFLLCWTIFGWIWGIVEATRYFEFCCC